VALTRPFAVLVGMTLAIHVISRTTGSGWLVVVVSGLGAVLSLSTFLPGLALGGIRVSVQAPADAVAGRPASFSVTAVGRARAGKLRLAAPSGDWVRLDGPGTGQLTARPARRGIVDHVDVELRSAAPFGLVWWRRRLRVPLERPMEVGPAPLDGPSPPIVDTGMDPAAGAALAQPSPEMVRGLRDYVPGDPRRLVSWAATARHGRLIVKDLEGPANTQLTLVVDLRGDETAAEVAASQAAGLAVAALAQGTPVLMATAEARGPVLGQVMSPLQVSRRLARATADGPPAVPEPGARVQIVRAGGR